MAEQKPLVIIGGQIQQLPSGDIISGVPDPGIGMPTGTGGLIDCGERVDTGSIIDGGDRA
jgi:hypothetical protein